MQTQQVTRPRSGVQDLGGERACFDYCYCAKIHLNWRVLSCFSAKDFLNVIVKVREGSVLFTCVIVVCLTTLGRLMQELPQLMLVLAELEPWKCVTRAACNRSSATCA